MDMLVLLFLLQDWVKTHSGGWGRENKAGNDWKCDPLEMKCFQKDFLD